MIWKWADRKDNNFPTFHHEHARIESLEADFLVLSNALLSYVVDDTYTSESHLIDTLQIIINNRVGLSKK